MLQPLTIFNEMTIIVFHELQSFEMNKPMTVSETVHGNNYNPAQNKMASQMQNHRSFFLRI
jgi:hypothetical protein